jgi:predicted NBD/HSP70 family sugar kinase
MATLGIDIGGTKIKTGMVQQALVIEKKDFPTPKSLAAFSDLLKDIITTYRKSQPFTHIAFSVPGSVDEANTVFFGGAVPYLNEVNLGELISQQLEEPFVVTVENDAKAATLGELTLGNLQEVTNGAAIILGTGVGVGLCLNGQLYKGSHYQAGEVSFMIRDRAIAGADSFVGVGLSAVAFIEKLAACLQVENDGRVVFEALAEQENQEATALFLNYCKEVAVLCFNIQCLLDLDKLVIGGGISQQPRLIATIRQCYEGLFQAAPIIQQTLQPMTITAAKFQADANLIGAVKECFYDN